MGEFHEFNKIIQTKNELQKCKQIEMQQIERKKKRTIQTLDHRGFGIKLYRLSFINRNLILLLSDNHLYIDYISNLKSGYLDILMVSMVSIRYAHSSQIKTKLFLVFHLTWGWDSSKCRRTSSLSYMA